MVDSEPDIECPVGEGSFSCLSYVVKLGWTHGSASLLDWRSAANGVHAFISRFPFANTLFSVSCTN